MNKLNMLNTNKILKRTMDIICALLFMLILLPVYFVVSICVLTFLGWPIFFVQERPGLNGKPFKLIKFRSMINTKDNSESDAKRLTKFGVLLRKTSLDEIPEFWNVLKGEMSLVGPRPLLMEYLPLYSKKQFRRHDLRPGITGLAQVKGRNDIDWEHKFDYDIYYVDNCNIWMDIKIIFLTFFKVISFDKVNKAGCSTTEKFMGKGKEEN